MNNCSRIAVTNVFTSIATPSNRIHFLWIFCDKFYSSSFSKFHQSIFYVLPEIPTFLSNLPALKFEDNFLSGSHSSSTILKS